MSTKLLLSKEDIAQSTWYKIFDDCLDEDFRDSILNKLLADEKLHEAVASDYDTIAKYYFMQGFLIATQ